jgi:hypothetical protein
MAVLAITESRPDNHTNHSIHQGAMAILASVAHETRLESEYDLGG